MTSPQPNLIPKWLIPIDDWVKLIGGNRNLVVTDQDLVNDKEIVKGYYIHSLRGRDLRYAKFSRSDLKQIDFEHANLQHAALVSTDLKGSRFRRANLQGTSLRRANLLGADFLRANLLGADLSWANLQGTSLRRANLLGADFLRANLLGADLSWANLQGTSLRRANLLGADLSWANLNGADLRWASLQGTALRNTSLQGADIRIASLQGADLRGASLQGAELGRANLQGADLRGANLQGADLRWANLQGANLRGANLQGADLRIASLQGADLRGASLRGADLREAEFWQTRMNDSLTPPSFDARLIKIDWMDIDTREKARETISDLKNLADAMQRDKTPGVKRIALARDRATRRLRPLLTMRTRGELIDSKASMCALHASRDRKPSQGRTTTGSEARATILAQIACDDTTDKGNVARIIANRFSYGALANPDSAQAFLISLDEQSCHHIRAKLPKTLLRELQKRAAEERSSPQTDERPKRPKDAADYYCTTPSEPGQLPIPEGPPY